MVANGDGSGQPEELLKDGDQALGVRKGPAVWT